MKQKWLDLSTGQKVIFCIQIFLIVLFLILYSTVGKQLVTNHQGATLRCRTDGTVTTYSGKLDDKTAVFTVSENIVTYQIGDTAYGPYTIVLDQTAVLSEEDKPLNLISTKGLVGVEVWKGDLRLFRGSYHNSSSTFYLVDPEGNLIFHDEKVLTEVISSTGNSMVTTYTDAEEPGPYTVLKIAKAPDVGQRANFTGLLCGIFLCIACMASLLYADNLFRWNLRFSIRNAEDAEPSDWELFSRWVGWLFFTVLAIAIFILGLTGM